MTGVPLNAFGTLEDGTTVEQLVLGREPGPVLHLLTLGSTVHRLEITGGDGIRRNVALGHPTPQAYLASSDYIGGTVGRYANRIARGRFELDGRVVEVGAHDRGNHLHGGPEGFDRRIWTVEDHGEDHAVLSLDSPDGDQGFPGALTARAAWRVTGDRIEVQLSATADDTTLVNLTSHVYLNLDGEGAGTIDDHDLQVEADAYTPVDDTGIPLGAHAPVAGTAFDLRAPTRIGTALRRGDPQVAAARGIDHNYVLRGSGRRVAAVLTSARTRTRMTLRTDRPGLQVYTGNFLDGSRVSTQGGRYRQGDGIALEPQLFPDTPHHPEWPSAQLAPGETYRATMSWHFDSDG